MIGPRLKGLRAKKGITQEEMAELLSVTPQAISRWENGVSIPDTNFLLPIADLFGVSVDFLLREPNKPQCASPAEMIKKKVSFDTDCKRDRTGYYKVEGIVKNESDYDLDYLNYKITFYDCSGNIIDYNESVVSAVCAHCEKPFRTVSFCKKEIDRFEIAVTDMIIKNI